MRPAFTLVELLVAIVIVTIGLIAMAATAGLVAAHLGDGGRLTASAHAARTVLDSLGSQPCDAVVGGAGATGGVTLAWTARRDSVAATADVTTRAALRRGERRGAFRLIVPCRRD